MQRNENHSFISRLVKSKYWNEKVVNDKRINEKDKNELLSLVNDLRKRKNETETLKIIGLKIREIKEMNSLRRKFI